MENPGKQQSLTKMMSLDAAEQAKLKSFVGFTERDAMALKELLPVVTAEADNIVNLFYENLQRFPELSEVISNAGSSIERLKASQKRYLIELFQGDYGDSYFERRLRIGEVHNKIGLTPRWYLGSYAVYLDAITPLILRKYRFNRSARVQAFSAVHKIIQIDSDLAIETYIRKSSDAKFVDYKGQIEALGRSLGLIEFNLDGTVVTANANFLGMMGYTLDEVGGKHHRMFVDPTYANSAEYRGFWEKLGRGEFDAGEYMRIGKGGKEVWIQSSYNPIRDLDGKLFKVVKYATDITAQKQQAIEYKERVKAYSAVIEAVAHGDLRQRVDVKGKDELSTIGGNLNAMIESLAGISRQIGDATTTMSSTVHELQGTVNAQSAGASEQAAAVNETTSTLEEIKATSTQTLGKAQQLGEAAERTRREGEQGVQAVEQAIRGIEAIRERMDSIAQTILALSEQTQQIGEITAVVTNIAQQSKMLALNASIEAAKAGDAGKGFAVVATEVRDLAEQSQQSTAQVQKILQDIRHATDRAVMATEEGTKGVDAGVGLVQKSSEVMKQLGEVIRETAIAGQQIVAAVRQEVAGIDQVSGAMAEINKVTSQIVAGTQQSKNAAADLAKVAAELQASVSAYKM